MMSTVGRRRGRELSLLTLSNCCAGIGIILLLLGGVLLSIALRTSSTVAVHIGDSRALVEQYLGPPQGFQQQFLFDLDFQGYPHYTVQFLKNQHVYAMMRELWPEEQQDQSLRKQDCLAMLPTDAKLLTVIDSDIKNYPSAENYTSALLKKVFAGYTFNAPAGALEMIYHYRQVQKQENGQVVSTIQILACQVGMGKYTGNSMGTS